MLKLKVLVKPDGSLEASGRLLGKSPNAGASSTNLSIYIPNYKTE
jgi:hypothetical protein